MSDRFAHEGEPQLSAIIQANNDGLKVCPVWNKSNREHTIVGSEPDDLRAEADETEAARQWKADYYVDADHIGLKTAGTTRLEEVIGLSEAGGDELRLAKDLYRDAHPLAADLIAPYASVVDIDLAKLPRPGTVERWNSADHVFALRHDPNNPLYDRVYRQFIHVGFKVAAKMVARSTGALNEHQEIIALDVTHKLLERHPANF